MENIKLAIRDLQGLIWDWAQQARHDISQRCDLRLAAGIDKECNDNFVLFNAVHPVEQLAQNQLMIVKGLIDSQDREIYGDKS